MRSRVALKRTASISRRGHGGEMPAALGQAAERIVVVHESLAVGADLQVGFDAVAAGDGRGEGGRRVLDRRRLRRHAARDGRWAAR